MIVLEREGLKENKELIFYSMAFKLKYNKSSFPFKNEKLIKSAAKGYSSDYKTSGAGSAGAIIANVATGITKKSKNAMNKLMSAATGGIV